MTGDDAAAGRYARHRGIPGWRQERLTAATAVVLGVGALGNEVVKNVALAGVGRIVLCDPDDVDVGNLSRSVLFGPDDVGRPKVEAAAGALRRLGLPVAVDARRSSLTRGVGLGELADADMVLGCLDSTRARLELLGRCALADATLVDGGTGPWSGEVRVRTDAESPCWSCSLGAWDRGVSDVPRDCREIQGPGEEAASVVTTTLVAGWMTAVGLRLVFGEEPPARVLRIDVAAGRTGGVELTRDPRCPHHRPARPRPRRIPVTSRDTVADLFAAVPAGSEVEVWSPLSIPLKCRSCGTRSDYDSSHAAAQPARCVTCGAEVRIRRSKRLGEAGPQERLSVLGVAPQEMLPVRSPEGLQSWVRLSG